jgi:Pvc16 N-terminal domain
MPIQAVTEAIRDVLQSALNDSMGMPQGTFTAFIGPPDIKNDDDELILFLMRVTPSAEHRNAERIRRWPTQADPPRRIDMAVAMDLHFLATAGSPQNTTASDGLRRLGFAIQAIESASPISVPSAFQDAVWLSIEPLSTDELSRIWGLFPNFNCRTAFVFCASPVWIDPRRIADPAVPVVNSDTMHRPLVDA